MIWIYIYTTETCSQLSDPANGIVRWTGLTTGSLAVYICDSGYELSGEQIRTCMSNGMWSGQEPTCIRKKNTFVMFTQLYRYFTYLLHEYAHVTLSHMFNFSHMWPCLWKWRNMYCTKYLWVSSRIFRQPMSNRYALYRYFCSTCTICLILVLCDPVCGEWRNMYCTRYLWLSQRVFRQPMSFYTMNMSHVHYSNMWRRAKNPTN